MLQDGPERKFNAFSTIPSGKVCLILIEVFQSYSNLHGAVGQLFQHQNQNHGVKGYPKTELIELAKIIKMEEIPVIT